MLMCPLDTCVHCMDDRCIKPDVVLKVSDTETDSLECTGYKQKEILVNSYKKDK